MQRRIAAGMLETAYHESGPPDGWPVILLHGFPYDAHSYDAAAPLLGAAGARVIVPYLRGFGPTRFRDRRTPRSGQQGALGHDLLALMDALGIASAVLAGHDWGGRAACIVAALWPERVRGLVSGDGYNIQDIARAAEPSTPEAERRYWYQYYFHGDRGRRGLAANRRSLCRLLWQTWSPNWTFDEATFALSAEAFDNPDFVEVVIHSYRHRYGLVPGDPALDAIEQLLAARPPITVPAITLDGEADGVGPIGGTRHHARQFAGWHAHRTLPRLGHNIAQESPRDFADAVLAVRQAGSP